MQQLIEQSNSSIDNNQKVKTLRTTWGRLAQLEERLVCNQKAGGSNPPVSTIILSFWALGS